MRNVNFEVLGEIIKDSAQALKSISSQFITFTGKNPNKLEKDSAAVCALDGKKKAIYKDENAKEHIITSRCPHLGCEMKWNADDKTWECPCHGSRFSVDGNVLNEPAQKDI